MIEKTTGVVLDVRPVSETSRLAAWITPDFGKIFTMIKGSQRPKSAFLGQYDLFYTCELLFYERTRTNLHIARECSPLSIRSGLRTHWRACACASYAAGLVDRVCQPGDPQPEIYDLLNDFLDDLHGPGAAPVSLLWFELRLLAILGLAPRLRHCAVCGRPRRDSSRPTRFSHARGGLVCRQCEPEPTPDAIVLRPDLLAALSALQGTDTVRRSRTLRFSSPQVRQAAQLLGPFLHYHLDTELRGRDIVLNLLMEPRQSTRTTIH